VEVGIEGLRLGVVERECESVTDWERVLVDMNVRELVPVSEGERVVDVDAVRVPGLTDAELERDTDVPERDKLGGLAVGERLGAEWVGESERLG